MEPQFRAAHGAAAWQISNPPVLAAAPLIASLSIFLQAGTEALRAKSLALTDFLDELIRPLAPALHILTPADSARRGCQLSLRIGGSPGRGKQVFAALSARGMVCDWRAPDIIRVAPVPLYNRFEDVHRFAEELALALREIP